MTADEARDRWPCLTGAQIEAVVLLEAGYSIRGIGRELGTCKQSVKTRLDAAERRVIAHREHGEAC